MTTLWEQKSNLGVENTNLVIEWLGILGRTNNQRRERVVIMTIMADLTLNQRRELNGLLRRSVTALRQQADVASAEARQ